MRFFIPGPLVPFSTEILLHLSPHEQCKLCPLPTFHVACLQHLASAATVSVLNLALLFMVFLLVLVLTSKLYQDLIY